MTWTTDELTRLDRAQELRVAGRRDDGSLRRLVIIWAVVVDGAVYIRSARGTAGGWYRGVQQRHEGRIESGGVAADTTFADAADDEALAARIDAAYAAKYPSYASSVAAVVAPNVRATTLRVDKA